MTRLHVGALRRGAMAALFCWGLWASAGNALAAGACTISSTGLAFGAYQPLSLPGLLNSTDRTSTATVSVACSAIAVGGSYTLSLGAGSYGPGDRVSTRYLGNTSRSGDPMAFNVYTLPNHGTIWGNGAAGSLLSGSIPTGNSNQSHTVYGLVPGGQNTLQAGSYGDSVTMTITYNP